MSRNVTLDVDDDGIWLIEDADGGAFQMGHVSWRQIYIHLEKYRKEQENENEMV